MAEKSSANISDLQQTASKQKTSALTEQEFWQINSSRKAQQFIAAVAEVKNVDHTVVHAMVNTVSNLDGKNASFAIEEDIPSDIWKQIESAGLIPPTHQITHAVLLKRIIAARDQLDRSLIVSAFVSSLNSGLLFLRSALGSYSHALHLEKHRFTAWKPGSDCCGICRSDRTENVQSYLWRRMMYAGNINQGDLGYVMRDLEDFGTPNISCGKRDVAVFKKILAAIRKLPPDAGLSELQKSLTGIFKANKYQRQVVLEILGTCGVLKPQESISMHEQYVPWPERPWPTHFYRKDWKSPVNCWTGADGVNEEAVDFWFGELL